MRSDCTLSDSSSDWNDSETANILGLFTNTSLKYSSNWTFPEWSKSAIKLREKILT
jgi:hypothetical protein